jgi:hypothetical protein
MRDLDSIALDRQCSSCLHLGCAGSNDGGGTSHKGSQVGKGGSSNFKWQTPKISSQFRNVLTTNDIPFFLI